jgi:hypothetical protein
MLFLSIPKPCPENWDEMSARDQGAFCSVCSKTVIDFTALSDEEVKNYFFQNREQKTCGRFRHDQLTEPETLHELLSRPIPFWKKFLAIVCIVFGNFLSGCQSSTVGKMEQNDATTNNFKESLHVTTGVTLMDILPDSTFSEKCVSATMGEPAIITEDIIEPQLLVGDVGIQIIEEPEERPDTVFFTGEIKEDSIKNANSGLPKIDSVKKNMLHKDCDTLVNRSIEP